MPRGARDANEPECKEALEGAGFEVIQLEDPDKAGVLDLLAIGLMPCDHCGLLVEQARLIEVKTKRGKLRPEQAAMLARHTVAARLARSGLEALEAVGRTATRIKREARNIAQTGQSWRGGLITGAQVVETFDVDWQPSSNKFPSIRRR